MKVKVLYCILTKNIILQFLKEYSWFVFPFSKHLLQYFVIIYRQIFTSATFQLYFLFRLQALQRKACLLLHLYRGVSRIDPRFNCCHVLQIMIIIMHLLMAPSNCILLGVLCHNCNQCEEQEFWQERSHNPQQFITLFT